MKSYLTGLKKTEQIIIGLFSMIFLLSPAICKAQNLLSEPQKIVVDAKRNRLLVSNFRTGDIVQIDSSGNQSYFVADANFVDGLEIVGDTVYGVGNGRNVRGYDLVTKRLVLFVTIPGAGNNYLSSITSDSSGHFFISCPRLNTIYKMRISDRSVWIFASANGLNKPNGILLEKEKNRIVVIDDSGASKVHAISLMDSTVSTLITTTLDRPDGIVRDKSGDYYIGGYYLPGIYKLDSDFSQPPVLFWDDDRVNPSFIYPTYDAVDNSLLVTLYSYNSWQRIYLGVTGVGSIELPKNFLLFQNYPNPFNPSTKIRYDLPVKTNVNLKIYNVQSQEVKTLVNEIQLSGSKTVVWDGMDNNGTPASIWDTYMHDIYR